MKRSVSAYGLGSLAFFAFFAQASAQKAYGASDFDISRLYQEIRLAVLRHYPEASAHHLNRKIHFEHNTRIFIIHEPRKNGQWQDPWETRGPNKGGVYCDAEIRNGKYGGAAGVPQTMNKRYFRLLLLAPYSEKLDAHLYIHLKIPRDVPDGFLEDLIGIFNGFEAYVSRKGQGG